MIFKSKVKGVGNNSNYKNVYTKNLKIETT